MKKSRTLFDIGDNKAPGPDGFSSIFFKKAWNIVGSDVCLAVRDFFRNGKLLKEVNHTIIALIPKKSPLRSMSRTIDQYLVVTLYTSV